MKKFILLFWLTIISITAYSQAWVMDEIADEAKESGHIEIEGIIFLIIIIIVIYIVRNVITSNKLNSKENKYKCIYENIEDSSRISKDWYICPICGKQKKEDDYETLIVQNENETFHSKCCKTCGNQFNRYNFEYYKWQSKKKNELPDWYAILIFIIMIISDIAWCIYHYIIGDSEFLIGRLFFSPIIIFVVMGTIGIICLKAFEPVKPRKPFANPTKQHVIECNALIIKKKPKSLF